MFGLSCKALSVYNMMLRKMQKSCKKKFFFSKNFFSDPHFSPKPSPQKAVILGDVSHVRVRALVKRLRKIFINDGVIDKRTSWSRTLIWYRRKKNISGVACKLLHTQRGRSRSRPVRAPRGRVRECPGVELQRAER
jgi:hypothetical protein